MQTSSGLRPRDPLLDTSGRGTARQKTKLKHRNPFFLIRFRFVWNHVMIKKACGFTVTYSHLTIADVMFLKCSSKNGQWYAGERSKVVDGHESTTPIRSVHHPDTWPKVWTCFLEKIWMGCIWCWQGMKMFVYVCLTFVWHKYELKDVYAQV